jgi:primosomal protein N'
MTIKVIHRGIRPQDKWYTTACNSCNSVLDFNDCDTSIKGDQRDSYYSLKCPVCNYEISMSKLTEKRS